MPFDGAIAKFMASGTADRRRELGLRNGQWYERWPDFATLNADFVRTWVPGWRRWPAPLINGFVEVDAGAPFTGIGKRVREMHCEHSADTIRLSLGRRRRRNRPGGPIKAITPPNEVAVGLARTITTAFPVTIIHSEETFDFFLADDGNDSLDGLTPATAWRTPGRLQTATAGFAPGTRAGSKRGSRFTSGYTPQSSGTSGNEIVFGAYDAGVIPRFDGDHSGQQPINMSNKDFVRFEFQRWEQWDGGPADFSNCEDLFFLNCEALENFTGNGFRLRDGSHRAEIDGGNFNDNGNTAEVQGARGHGIAILEADDVVVRNCISSRNTEDSIQIGNTGTPQNLLVEDVVGKNNGEDFFDVKHGSHTLRRFTAVNDNTATARGGLTNGRKGINIGQSDAATLIAEDGIIHGWGLNGFQGDSIGKLIARRCFFDDKDRATGHLIDAKGPNAGCTLEACLVVVRGSGLNAVRFNDSTVCKLIQTTVYQAHASATTDLVLQATAGNALTLVNSLMVHGNAGLCLEIDQVSDLVDGDNNVFDNASGDFANVDGTGFNSGEVAGFNTAMSSTGNVHGDPQFASAGGISIDDYLPGSGGTAHRAGKAGSGVTLDINGDTFSVSPLPTAGCLQRAAA